MDEGPKVFAVVDRHVVRRKGCAERVLCKTDDEIVIAVCGRNGDNDGMRTIVHANLPFTMTVEAHALQYATLADSDFWVPWDAAVTAIDTG